MLKSLDLITIINNKHYSTYYLFNKTEKIILPINIYQSKPMDMDFTNCTFEIISTLLFINDNQLLNIRIYLYQHEQYYSYLTFKVSGRVIEMNLNINTSLILSQYFKLPILIEEEILLFCGLKINKEMIKKALGEI